MSQNGSTTGDYCVFRRGDRSFAVSTRFAKEIIESRALTAVPLAPPELLGALNLRGEVVPLVALDSLLEIDVPPRPRADALLVVASGDLRFAAVVDRVDSVRHFAPWEIRRDLDVPSPAAPLLRGYTSSAGERLFVLDGEALITAVAQRIADGFRSRSLSRRGDAATEPQEN